MSTQVNVAHVQQYRDNFIHLVQQEGSRLRGSVRSRTDVQGKHDHFDRIGQTTAQQIVSRHADTPLISTPHSRRRVSLNDYNWADLIDKADEIRMLGNPQSDYLKAGVWAMGRQIDDILISAYTANAVAIDSSDATSNVAFDSTNQQIAGGSTDLTLAKIIQAAEKLNAQDVDPDEEKFFVVGSAQVAAMLGITSITSADFNSVKTLVEGKVASFMGFKFIRSERLPLNRVNASSNERSCFAYVKSAIGLSVGMDIETRVSEREDKNYSTQVYAQMSFGATRIEEEKIVEILCDEDA